MHKTAAAGLTLIELLIVIAIIGLLAAVVVPRLDSARDGGREARILTQMDAITKRASIESSTSLTYDVVCGSNGFSTSTSVQTIIDNVSSFAEGPVVCNSATERYALSVPMASSTHWCVDSAGARKEIGAALGVGDLVCP